MAAVWNIPDSFRMKFMRIEGRVPKDGDLGRAGGLMVAGQGRGWAETGEMGEGEVSDDLGFSPL